MGKTIIRILLVGIVISFVQINGYAEDKKVDYNSQTPNYNDPSKPNYISGTRTDMAPKIEGSYQITNPNVLTNKEDSKNIKSISEYKPSNTNKSQKELEQEQWQLKWGEKYKEEYKTKKETERWESLNQ